MNVGTVAHEGDISPDRFNEADWGGGYYEPGLSQADFNQHLLIMYGEGESGSAAVCLPAGSVYGVGRDENGEYFIGPVKVGRDSLKPGQPVHQ